MHYLLLISSDFIGIISVVEVTIQTLSGKSQRVTEDRTHLNFYFLRLEKQWFECLLPWRLNDNVYQWFLRKDILCFLRKRFSTIEGLFKSRKTYLCCSEKSIIGLQTNNHIPIFVNFMIFLKSLINRIPFNTDNQNNLFEYKKCLFKQYDING